jgi:hypothetical protein
LNSMDRACHDCDFCKLLSFFGRQLFQLWICLD